MAIHHFDACGPRVLRARALPLLVALGLSQACLAGSLDYQAIAGAAPEPLPARGPTTREEMEAFLDGFMSVQMHSGGPVAGAMVVVVKDGAVFFEKGYGYEDTDKQVAVDPEQTLFRPGSVSKLFTWTAVMQLVEQGKLDLDADVNTYLKDFKIPATYPQPITLRNLLTHTPGLEDGGVGYLFAESEKNLQPLGQWLAAHVPVRVRPATTDFSSGANASYSNWGAALAGYIVETVSGMPFDDYVEQHIFVPLGMTRSTFREPLSPELAQRMSGGYSFEEGRFESKGFEFIHAAGPAGSLSATGADMGKFMLAHLQDGALGEGRILSPATARLMHTRAMSPDPALNGGALGFYETWINGHRIIGHGGDTTHFHSVLALLPEAKLGLFASVNTGGKGARTSYALEKAFFDHYFPAHLPQLKPPADATTRNARYAGSYRGLRQTYTTFEKAFAAGGDFKVEPMPDGTLMMPDPIFGDPGRWSEVGEGVYRQADDDVFVAFKAGAGGRGMDLVGPFPPIAATRIAWYESSTLHAVILGIGILLFITTVVSAIRQRRADRAGAPDLRWARPALALAGVLLIAFLLGIAAVLGTGIEKLIYHIPSAFYVALALPLIAVPLVLAAVYFTWQLWKTRAWRVGARLHYTFAALAAFAFLVVLNYWNLLGYRLG
ncbi:MAG TPA: serine hydrolase [Steroidobacteraceae bacterium]|nr:serine hydrolase [Steroidobacteraceae bacterium]